MTPIEIVTQNLSLYQSDPTRVQREVLAMARGLYNGEHQFVDPTNPVVGIAEAASVLFTSFLTENEAATRKLYPALAQTPEDLYRHMSDKDYVNRFATPSKTTFNLLIAEDELLMRMVDDPTTRSRKIVIPRNTFFTVGGYVFSLQYPIVISQLQHGGLQIVYDVSQPSPLQALETNAVDWDVRVDPQQVRWIHLSFSVAQFDIKSKVFNITTSKEFTLNMSFDQEFYFARVYVETASGWQEIRTTHTDQVYDPFVITSVLKVVNKNLEVKIPQIYTNTILASKKVRVDLYQTRGTLNLDLSEYTADKFGVTWKNYNAADDTVFTAPMRNFQQLIPYSASIVRGGNMAKTTAELRNRVMQNGPGSEVELPISVSKLKARLEEMGYGVVRDIDNITSRVFLATRAMPAPRDSRLITAAAAGIETVSVELDKVVLLDTVIDNGGSVTITPKTMYRQDNGITKPVASEEVAQVMALPADRRAASVSAANWRYSPFHYVLDASGIEFELRPYYLDAPEAVTKLFVAENATTLLQVATGAYGIFRTEEGYTLQIVTVSSQVFRDLLDSEVHVQLAYIPQGEKDRAYLNGTYMGRTETNERIFNFDLSTNFNVTRENLLQLTKFLMYTEEPRLSGVGLTTDFDILYSVSTPMDAQWTPTDIDRVLGRFVLPKDVAGVTHETIRLKFGEALKTLWAQSRSYVIGEPYKKWTVNVPLLYENDVYERFPNGSTISFDADGKLVMNKLYSKGDPVLDYEGNPIYKFKIGDIMLDSSDNPIPVGPRAVRRMVDIMMVDGVYWFATDTSATTYRKELTRELVSWLVEDLADISKKVLEKTRIYFYPKTTMGMIDVVVGDGLVKSIPAGQSFKVVLQVSDLVYRNEALRKRLVEVTVATISKHLENPMVSMSAIHADLREQYGDDVLNPTTTGLGGSDNLSSLRVLDDATRCSLRKRLVALADDTLITEEAVSVEFVRLKAPE